MTDPLLAVTIAIGAVAVLLIVFDQRAGPRRARSQLTDWPRRAATNPSWPRAGEVHGLRSGGNATAECDLIEFDPDDKRYVPRDEDGQLVETEDVGKASGHD